MATPQRSPLAVALYWGLWALAITWLVTTSLRLERIATALERIAGGF